MYDFIFLDVLKISAFISISAKPLRVEKQAIEGYERSGRRVRQQEGKVKHSDLECSPATKTAELL
jgi:hypothetical protein